MSPRLLVALALTIVLAGCVTTGNDDDGLQRMERNHAAALETTA